MRGKHPMNLNLEALKLMRDNGRELRLTVRNASQDTQGRGLHTIGSPGHGEAVTLKPPPGQDAEDDIIEMLAMYPHEAIVNGRKGDAPRLTGWPRS